MGHKKHGCGDTGPWQHEIGLWGCRAQGCMTTGHQAVGTQSHKDTEHRALWDTGDTEPRRHMVMGTQDYGDIGPWGQGCRNTGLRGQKAVGGRRDSPTPSATHRTRDTAHENAHTASTQKGAGLTAPLSPHWTPQSPPPLSIGWRSGGARENRKCRSALFPLLSVVPMRKRTAAAVRTGRKRGRRAWGGVQRGLRRSGASPALSNTPPQRYLTPFASSHLESLPLSLSYPLTPIASPPLLPPTVPHGLPHPRWPHAQLSPIIATFPHCPPVPIVTTGPSPPSRPPHEPHIARGWPSPCPHPLLPSLHCCGADPMWDPTTLGPNPRPMEPL